MKIRRIISCLLAFILCSSFPLHASATQISEDNVEIIIHDQDRHNTINELFTLRNQLELDYEINQSQIEQIDQQLARLGVEEISYGEVLSKLGYDALPNIDFESTSTTSWTSRRVVVTFNGKHYELQILEGVPISGNSPLRTDTLVAEHEASGVVVGLTEGVKVVGAWALGSAAVVGNKLSAGLSVYEMLCDVSSAIYDSLSTTSEIDHVSSSATVSLTVHMRYILVKPYETQDAGNQATCYIGNAVSCRITTVSVVDMMVNGKLVTEHDVTSEISDTIYSPHYDDFSVPARTYYNYRYNGVTQYNDKYYINQMAVSLLGKTGYLPVPHELPNFN